LVNLHLNNADSLEAVKVTRNEDGNNKTHKLRNCILSITEVKSPVRVKLVVIYSYFQFGSNLIDVCNFYAWEEYATENAFICYVAILQMNKKRSIFYITMLTTEAFSVLLSY